MNVVANSKIKHNGQVYNRGQELSVSDEQGQALINVGAAHVAERKTAKQAPVQTSRQSNDGEQGTALVKVSVEMKREELDQVAEDLGMTDLEQYGTKAELVEAIETKQHQA